MHIIWAIIFLSWGWGALSYNPNVHTHGQNRCVYYKYIDCTRVEDCSFLENSLLLFCIRYLFLRFFSVFPQGQKNRRRPFNIENNRKEKRYNLFLYSHRCEFVQEIAITLDSFFEIAEMEPSVFQDNFPCVLF